MDGLFFSFITQSPLFLSLFHTGGKGVAFFFPCGSGRIMVHPLFFPLFFPLLRKGRRLPFLSVFSRRDGVPLFFPCGKYTLPSDSFPHSELRRVGSSFSC